MMRPADMSDEQIAGLLQARQAARRVPHVGTYHRRLPVSLARMYENALDWEHLPYLHESSFCDIACEEAGDWGWRARAGLRSGAGRQEVLLELRLNRELRRWITTTLAGPGEGAEIWTHVFELDERRIEINVDFFVPGVSADDVPVVGEVYRALYAQLYDEDERMMTERQAALDARETPRPDEVSLGPLAQVKAGLPLSFELGTRRYSLVESDGELLAYTTTCPHMLGPLEPSSDRGHELRCPWHAYRFDAASGRCLSGQKLRLAPSPTITVTSAGIVVASLPS